jgi:metal-responsive CopG/Arc/MetJ family transcriptional regulator
MEQQIQDVAREEGRTRSELLREALRRYVDDRRFRLLSRQISERTREAGIVSEEQVNELMHDQRHGRK